MSKNEKLNKFRNQLKGSIKRIELPIASDKAEVVEKDKEYHIYYIPGNFSNFFEELDVLGEGCVGLVKKVKKIETGEYFACKMVKLKDDETILQVISEFKNIKKLNHPNIVRVYELYVDEIKRRIYTIMELVEAREMFEVIRKLGSYSEEIASKIFKQVLTCIRYMHEECVCHRDLKPNNILATEDGQCVKITDFNISKFGSTSKKEQFYNKNIKMWTYTGTVSFSAPEVFSEDEYDQSVDIWSAGVVLYTMLSGGEPFQAEYLQDLIAKIQNADYSFQSEIWSSISNDAKDLIQKCLILNPKERITPEQALLHPWITGKQNTSPLTLIIFNNFENNARRLSKKVHAYQNLGLMKPVNRKISIDCSILQRSMNHYNESEFNAESPYAVQLASMSQRSRKDSEANSKCSTQSQQACIRNDQIRTDSQAHPQESEKFTFIISPPTSPPIKPNISHGRKTSIFAISTNEDETHQEQEFDQVINRYKSSTQSDQPSQSSAMINSKVKRMKSLQIEQESDYEKMQSNESQSSKKIAVQSNFSRFARSQKTHKTLILHDRYKLNEEEQFLLSQNQFSEQVINPTFTNLHPYQSSQNINHNNQLNINPSLIFFGDGFNQQNQRKEGSMQLIPPEQAKLDYQRKQNRYYTVNNKSIDAHLPK